jgi:hypothetical protein
MSLRMLRPPNGQPLPGLDHLNLLSKRRRVQDVACVPACAQPSLPIDQELQVTAIAARNVASEKFVSLAESGRRANRVRCAARIRCSRAVVAQRYGHDSDAGAREIGGDGREREQAISRQR